MHILLAAPRGFCAGVNMAIHTLDEALTKYGAPLYVFHEIVHNNHVVEGFRARGAVFVDSLEEVPDGVCVMYSAHGVSPEVRKRSQEKDLRVIDATCPLVGRVHRQAKKLAEEGFSVLLIGHAGHDEIVGIVGEAPDAIQTLCSVEDVEKISVPDPQKVAYLTQTTLSLDETEAVIEKLRQRFPSLRTPVPSCICYATQNRQRGVRELAGRCEIVLVVGSDTSSNSRRLKELALRQGVRAMLIDGVEELSPGMFQDVQTVLITAGASAPEWVVQSIVRKLQETFSATLETVEICKETLQFKTPIDAGKSQF